MGGGSKLRIGDARTPIVPDSDLGLQGSFPLSHIASSDVDPVLAVLTAQSPIGPKLVKCDADGNLIAAVLDAPLPSTTRVFSAAIGGGVEFDVPEDQEWEILTFLCTYSASVAVGTRHIEWFASDGSGNVFWESFSAFNHLVGDSHEYLLTDGSAPYTIVIAGDTKIYLSKPSKLIVPEFGSIGIMDKEGIDPTDTAHTVLSFIPRAIP